MTHSEITISVIVPVYNGAPWIAGCLQALQGQTVAEQMELILVDDGSTDGSTALLDAVAGDRVRVLHQSNRGVSAARNAGIEAAVGIYLAFADIDDYPDADFYQHLLEQAEGYDLVCGGYTVEYPDHAVRCAVDAPCTLQREEAVAAYLGGRRPDPNIWDKLYRRATLGALRFQEGMVQSEDRLYVFACLCRAERVRLIPCAGYHYRMNPRSVTHGHMTAEKLACSAFAKRICRETAVQFPALLPLAECFAIDVSCRALGELYRWGQEKEFPRECAALRREIRRFPLRQKLRCSSAKHTLALLAAKVHPRVYCAIKYGMKLQYR